MTILKALFDGCVVKIYTGSRPASPDDEVDESRLWGTIDSKGSFVPAEKQKRFKLVENRTGEEL